MQLAKTLATFFSSAEELVNVSSAELITSSELSTSEGGSDRRRGKGRVAGGGRRQQQQQTEEEADRTLRRQQKLLSVGADVQVLDDFDLALRQKVLRSSLLRAWVAQTSARGSIQRVEVSLLETEYTCGQGHEPDTLAGAMLCVPCPENSYKQDIDNSSCAPCPTSSFTNWSNAPSRRDSVEVCRCGSGLRPLSAGSIPRNSEEVSWPSADASSSSEEAGSDSSYWEGECA